MKTMRLALTLLTLAGAISAVTLTRAEPGARPAARSQAGVKWRTDLQAARAEARQQDRPMLVVFGADWCTYCRKMEQTTLADQALSKYINDSFIPVHLDLDHDARVAEILEVERIPCSVMLSPNADLLGRVTGYVDRGQYQQALNRVQNLHQRVTARKP